RYAVVGIGQHLAERGRADAPRPRPRRLVLVSAAETELRDRALPSLPARAALIAEAAQVLAAVAEQIPVAGDVEAGRPAAVVVAVAEALDLALGAAAKVVIHQVAAEHAGARAQAVGPDVGRGAHQDPSRVQRRRAEKDY